ncbi:hypothetical protein RAA17_02355 [Komagataeibacter rhaeticus]|nr:hypothetical protein [Komagataeibacter rhaeticus]
MSPCLHPRRADSTCSQPAPAGAPTEASLGLSARNLARQIHEDGAEATARALDAHRSWPQLRRAVAAGGTGGSHWCPT